MAAQQVLRFRNNVPRSEKIFQLDRQAAEHSALVRMLLQDFDEASLADAIIPLTIDVSDAGLSIIFTWMEENRDLPKATDDDNDRSTNNNTTAASTSATAAPPLPSGPVRLSPEDRALFDGLDSELLFEVLVASNYLEVKPLYERACAYVAYLIRGQTPDQIRYTLGIGIDGGDLLNPSA